MLNTQLTLPFITLFPNLSHITNNISNIKEILLNVVMSVHYNTCMLPSDDIYLKCANLIIHDIYNFFKFNHTDIISKQKIAEIISSETYMKYYYEIYINESEKSKSISKTQINHQNIFTQNNVNNQKNINNKQ